MPNLSPATIHSADRRVVELETLALVAERTSNLVMILDAQGCINWANEAFSQLSGCTLDDAIGQRPGELFECARADPDVTSRLREAVRLGAGAREQVLNRWKDGSEHWVDTNLQPLHDAQGQLTGYIEVQTEITSQVTQRHKMMALLAALPVGVIVQSLDGTILDANPSAAEMLGLKLSELLGRTTADPTWRTVREDLSDCPGVDLPAMRTLRTGKGLRGEVLGVVRSDGDTRWLTINTEPLNDALEQCYAVVACFSDVTAQRAQQQLLEVTVEGAGVGTWQWNLATDEVTCNDRFFQMQGYQRGEIGSSLDDWRARAHPDDLAGMAEAVMAHLADPRTPCRSEHRLRHRDGHWHWYLMSGAVVARTRSGKPLRMAGIRVDINHQKQLEQRLRDSARTDSLTQLPNRAVVLERVQQAIEQSRLDPACAFAVLFMDFDRFKQVNDTLGHGVGDELLRLIALRLTRALRPNDAVGRTAGPGQLAARIGGDEFVVVLEGIHGRDDAIAVARRLLDVLSHPYEIGAHRLHSSASIGIVTTEHATGSAEDALRDADIAMYEAKRAGRARFVMFEPTMHEQARRSLSLENDLRRALVGGELFVVYQPVLNLQTGRPTGVEALARWQHPTRGLVPPAEFIPVAEASGLIGAVGNLVLETACQQMVQWQRSLSEQCPEMMAVNLSRAQLGEPGLVDEVRQVLQRSGLDARHLKLEITESLAAQDETVQATLRDLKSLGLRLALDDFGTGYSSLACLHLLPVDTVKIDRSFVSQIETSEYHRVLIEATIRVAATLGMSTVAEGIETAGQADLLLQLNCEKGQGYLYSKPLRSDELAHWMTGIGRRHERSAEAGSPARAAAVGDRQRADHAVHATPD